MLIRQARPVGGGRCSGEHQAWASVRPGGVRPQPVQQRAWSCIGKRLLLGAKCKAVTSSVEPAATSEAWLSPAVRQSLFGQAVEQPQEVEASIEGTIPSWLQGSLIQNGGGDYRGMTHMFDGYSMISKVRISGGKVYGSQRYLQSRAYKHFSTTGKMVAREFGTPVPAASTWEWLVNTWKLISESVTGEDDGFSDNSNVSLLPLADGSLLAMSEVVSTTHRVDPVTLDTLEHVKYNDGVPGTLTLAHPCPLPGGDVLNCTRTVPGGGYHLYRQDLSTLRRTKVAFVPDMDPARPRWIHDFVAIGDEYAVIVENPLHFNLGSLMLGTPAPYVCMDWEGQSDTLVRVVSLDGSGTVRTLKAPPFWTFHFGNAYRTEDGASLHLDFAGYDDPKILNELLLAPLLTYPGSNLSSSSMRRLVIPLDAPEGSRIEAPQELILDTSAHGNYAEFPAVAPAARGRPYRYCYMLSAKRPTSLANALSKVDILTGEVRTWQQPGGAPGEPMFLPAPGATSEDEGVVIATVIGPDCRSFLVMLDGQSFKELGRAVLPFALPNRFHGCFVPEA